MKNKNVFDKPHAEVSGSKLLEQLREFDSDGMPDVSENVRYPFDCDGDLHR